MKDAIEAMMNSLTHTRGRDIPTPSPGSLYWDLVIETTRMADSYIADCGTFLSRGDMVNALASLAYADGWRDMTLSFGLLKGDRLTIIPPGQERVPNTEVARFLEKATRYERLLTAALNGTCDWPERATVPGMAADRTRLVARASLVAAARRNSTGDHSRGLFFCSYGHAWIDCGIRAGFFRVTGPREIFSL